jgi:hypothetical protein
MLPPPTIPPPPLPPPTFRLPLPPPCMLDEVIPKLAYGGAPDPTEDEGEGEDSAIPLSPSGVESAASGSVVVAVVVSGLR